MTHTLYVTCILAIFCLFVKAQDSNILPPTFLDINLPPSEITTTAASPPPLPFPNLPPRRGPNRHTSTPLLSELTTDRPIRPVRPTRRPPTPNRPPRRPPTRQLRPCNPPPTLPPVNIVNLKSETLAAVTQESSTAVEIMTNITWAVDNDDFEIDGFIVKFFDNDQREIPILPTNVCNVGRGNYWANVLTTSSCINDTCTAISDNQDQENMTSCVCTQTCGGLTSRIANCIGVDNYYVTDQNFLSIQPNVRSLQFPIGFHATYTFEIRAYFRQYPFSRAFLSVVETNCPESLMRNGLSPENASQQCCDSNIPHYRSRDITFSKPIINHASDSMSINVKWFPPMAGQEWNYTLALGLDLQAVERTLYTGTKNTTSCLNFTYMYTAQLNNLKPGQDYFITIRPTGLSQSQSIICARGRCNSDEVLSIEDINACDEEFGYCDSNANCSASDSTGRTTFNATCTCSSGYEGNGINTTILGKFNQFASGCIDEDFCFSSNSCSIEALCFDNPAPELGVTCQCPESFMGDGKIDGNGCESITVFALKIAIPLLAIAIILLGLLAYKVKRRRDLKRDLLWSHFLNNDQLASTMLNSASVEGEGPWLPIFGEKWEIDRNDVKLNDVVGRGNYGIVYHGLHNNNFNKEVDVAIKMVKDGLSEDKAMTDFIYEIGFMLNVGSHPNVLGVIGCCTTQKPVMLITEYLKYGDLLHFLWDARDSEKYLVDPAYHVTEKSLCQMTRQVAMGMEYLTKTRIIHGDLAARNVLVGEDLICKISDFGLANDVYRYGILKGQCERQVPFKWVSPERMMEGKVPITSKSDVWSFGNLMYEMFTLGCTPHPGISTDDLLEKLREGYRMEQPKTCSNPVFAIMKKCWKWRSQLRPSFSELVESLGVEIKNMRNDSEIFLAKNIENLNLVQNEL